MSTERQPPPPIARTPLAPEAENRLREGSARGGREVRAKFAEVITRRRFCELVGIHRSTLKRWEKARVVEPALEPVIGIMTYVFTPEDVEFGQRLAGVLASRPGELSLVEGAAEVRRR
jgi:transcriptional regulator with XRE-family HTH domain